MDILFLSASFGGGHLKAAEALKEGIEERYPDSRILIVDAFKYVNPIVDKLIVGGYLNALKTTPQIYGMLYSMAETGDNIHDFSKTVNKLLSFRIKSLIYEYKPSLIVCTHPFPVQMMSNLKRKNKVNIPTVAVMTDYSVHPFWLHEHIDAYVVAHEYMKHQMFNRGIPENIIHPFGIPVSKNFLQTKERNMLLKELKLQDKQTILIMGGSLGFGEIKDTFLSLLNCRKDLQIIAITGKNVKLKKSLEKYSESTRKNVKILSYTNKVADLMDMSDFIITKPGGMTVTEALVKNLPMFIISPLPGHEERNAHFLINSGVAARILEDEDMDSILFQVVDNPLRVRHMKEIAQSLAKPNSTQDTIDMFESLVGGKSK